MQQVTDGCVSCRTGAIEQVFSIGYTICGEVEESQQKHVQDLLGALAGGEKGDRHGHAAHRRPALQAVGDVEHSQPRSKGQPEEAVQAEV